MIELYLLVRLPPDHSLYNPWSSICISLRAAPRVTLPVSAVTDGECHSWWQVGLVVHLFSATHFTYNKRKAIKKSPLTTGLLALTGTVLLVRPTRPFAP